MDITLKEAKEALGTDGADLTDLEILNLVDNIQALVRSWSEDYQRTIFKGKTIKDLLTTL